MIFPVANAVPRRLENANYFDDAEVHPSAPSISSRRATNRVCAR